MFFNALFSLPTRTGRVILSASEGSRGLTTAGKEPDGFSLPSRASLVILSASEGSRGLTAAEKEPG